MTDRHVSSPARDLADRLAAEAEAVCRHYLSSGRREGRYWLVGDVYNRPGRSLYVRLVDTADGGGKAGKWTDAQNGGHGDLLDIIAIACGHRRFGDTLDEARRFLSLPRPVDPAADRARARPVPAGSPEAARRLWSAARPLPGSAIDAYLQSRAIGRGAGEAALRGHPRCYYRPSRRDTPDTPRAWPALIAAITDEAGRVTAVHRTWIDGSRLTKAPVACPRRAMGHVLGHGIRFGASGEAMIFGEGVETMLSLREIMPIMPMIAGTSAAHLAAIALPACLRRLYVAVDADPAGTGALARLTGRSEPQGIEVVALRPALDDFNSDLVAFGRARLAQAIAPSLHAADAHHLAA